MRWSLVRDRKTTRPRVKTLGTTKILPWSDAVGSEKKPWIFRSPLPEMVTYLYWCNIYKQRLKQCTTYQQYQDKETCYYTITTYTGKDVQISSNIFRFCVMIKFCIHHISSQLCTKIKVVHSNVQVFAVPWLLLNLCYLELIRKDCSIYTCMHLKFLLFGVLRIQFYTFACLTVKKALFCEFVIRGYISCNSKRLCQVLVHY